MNNEAGSAQQALDRGKAALRRKDFAEARRILSALVDQKPNGIAALFLARTELEDHAVDTASDILERFLAAYPDHPGGRAMRARIILARGDVAAARAEIDQALALDSGKRATIKAESEVRAAELASVAGELIAVVDARYAEARDGGTPSDELVEAARGLAALAPAADWGNDPMLARIAFFHHALDPVAALANYDPHLIDVSVEFDYVTWPKRIQSLVRGRSVIDVGCGFGGYGMGFLVAGATDYAGLDPVMKLDSTRAKNKRTRSWGDMGITPREIAETLPAIRLFECTAEEMPVDETFDTIALHNVTEHLIQLDLVFQGLVNLCKPDSRIVFLHHNFYCWNGHHFAPNRPDQLDLNNPEHLKVYDWNHIDNVGGLPEDHYFKTHLNRVRLAEIREITERYFDIVTWEERPSSPETLERLTPEIVERVRKTLPDMTEQELKTNVVFCVARPKR